jgi:hypothetical protein
LDKELRLSASQLLHVFVPSATSVETPETFNNIERGLAALRREFADEGGVVGPRRAQIASVSSDRRAPDHGFAHLTAPDSKALLNDTLKDHLR